MSQIVTDKIAGLSNPGILELPDVVKVKELQLKAGATKLLLPVGTACPLLSSTRATVGALSGLGIGQAVFLTDTHEVLVWDGTAFAPLGAIDTAISIPVGLGQTFTDLADAFDLIRTRRITQSGSVTFQLVAGTSPQTKAVTMDHPDGERIIVQGTTPVTTTVTSTPTVPAVSSVSGNNTSGYLVTFNVTGASSLYAVGDAITVKAVGRRALHTGRFSNDNVPSGTRFWSDAVLPSCVGKQVFITAGSATVNQSWTRTVQSVDQASGSGVLDSAIGQGAYSVNNTSVATNDMFYLQGGFDTPLTGKMRTNLNSALVTGDGTAKFTTELNVGDTVWFANMAVQVISIQNDNQFTSGYPARMQSEYYQGVSTVNVGMLNGTWRVSAVTTSTVTLAYMVKIATSDAATYNATNNVGVIPFDTFLGEARFGNMVIPKNGISKVILTKYTSIADTSAVPVDTTGTGVWIRANDGQFKDLAVVDCGTSAFASRPSAFVCQKGIFVFSNLALIGGGIQVVDGAQALQAGHLTVSNTFRTSGIRVLRQAGISPVQGQGANTNIITSVSGIAGTGLQVAESSWANFSDYAVSVASVRAPDTASSLHGSASVSVDRDSTLVVGGLGGSTTGWDGSTFLNVVDSCDVGVSVQVGSTAVIAGAHVAASGYAAMRVSASVVSAEFSCFSGTQDNGALVDISDSAQLRALAATFTTGWALLRINSSSKCDATGAVLSFSRNKTGVVDGLGNVDAPVAVDVLWSSWVTLLRARLSNVEHGARAAFGSSMTVDLLRCFGVKDTALQCWASCIDGAYADFGQSQSAGSSTPGSVLRLIQCSRNGSAFLYNANLTGFTAGNTTVDGVFATQAGIIDLGGSTSVPDSICTPDKNGTSATGIINQ